MPKQYKTFAKVFIDGTPDYCQKVEGCLDIIATLPDGQKLLNGICASSHTVTIKHTDSGNSCSRLTDSANPLLVNALETKAQINFQNELTVVLDKAKRGGITLEHLARQLSLGLSPATYQTSQNVVRPGGVPIPRSGPQGVMMQVGLDTAEKMRILKDLASGAQPVTRLPNGWERDLPRLLRNYLTPGRGSGSTVNFNATRTFHCVDDPAMHQRPPAVGLAHELIHALHNARGVRMGIVNTNNEKLEEIITTGFPPYNFEEISDNKMRTQWPTYLHLRENY